MKNTQYDLVVIGSGPGGYVAAIRAAQLGYTVAIVEKDKAGGVCLNVGCIPSKALIHQAELATSGKRLEDMGVKIDWTGLDYSKVHQKSRDAAHTLSKGVQFLIKKNKITYVKGSASIKDHTHVEVVENGAVQVLSTAHILIATGSHPREVPGFVFDELQVLSSTGILGLSSLPKSLIILGAGAIGLEFAHIMHAFGVKVTVVELLPEILNGADSEISTLMHEHCKKKGVEIVVNHKAQSLKKGKSGVQVVVKSMETGKPHTISADKILVAVGRAPNSDGLNLDAVGIQHEKGFIRTGDHYRTTVSNIYAIGDVIATPQLAHVASKEGEIAVEHMVGIGGAHAVFPSDLYPFAVYTDPEIAWFGPTEQEIAATGAVCAVHRFPYRGAGKSVAVEASEGVVKLCSDAKTGEIFSAHIFGKNATELIHELLLAKQAELLPEDIASMVHAHPTLSETILELARTTMGSAIHI